MVEAFIPKTINECLSLLTEKDLQIVAGGTDVLIQSKSHTSMLIGFKKDVLYINQIEEMKKIYEDDMYIYIGSTASLESIKDNTIVPILLRNTILEMASPAIRHTGTLAGNIANASPAGDSLVSLYILDALVEIKSLNNTRLVFIKDFIKGVRRIDLSSDEIITKIIVPKLVFTNCYFKKVGPRLTDAISKLSFGGAYSVDGKRISDIRIAFGAVNIFVVRNRLLEERLIGKTVSEIKLMIEEIISWYEPLIKPIDDQRSNKEYRKEVALNLLRSFIESLN
ncbi:MAG: FAD binding domain-containing protein [Candidatus Izemoplasmatales bacterium]